MKRLYGDNFMVDESLWSGRAPGKPFGMEGVTGRWSSACCTWSSSAEGGDIKRENVWVDLAAIIRQLPQD